MSRFVDNRALRAVNYRGRWFWPGVFAWIFYYAVPLVPGLITAAIFDGLSHRPAVWVVLPLVFLLVFVQVLLACIMYYGNARYMAGFTAAEVLIRGNVIRRYLSPNSIGLGTSRPAVGDILSRCRDEPRELVMLIDSWIDVAGSLIYAVAAITILAQVDVPSTMFAVGALLTIAVSNTIAGNVAGRFRRKAREEASKSSSFLAAIARGRSSISAMGAREQILARLRLLNEHRARAAVRETTFSEGLLAINIAAVDLAIGVALWVAAGRGLSAGEVALFVTFLVPLTWLPQKLALLILGRRHAQVAEHRLMEVMPGSEVKDLTSHFSMPLLGGSKPLPEVLMPPTRAPLKQLEVDVSLKVDGGAVKNLELQVSRGSLTVIQGAVGSGKSRLLRAIGGLVADEELGRVAWNGIKVDPRNFMRPPNCAYVPQVPRLISGPLLENFNGASPGDIYDAIELSGFGADLAEMKDGLLTHVGPGGSSLSGGQIQRLALARALVSRPELLLLDDMTSALDVDTENRLWADLASSGYTTIAVSNREGALKLATYAIVL
jgi:ATP-binding cassette, subfamily B, bacterial